MPGYISIREMIDFYLFGQFRKNETKLHELRYLFWECTLRCNLDCLHCGSDCTAVTGIPDMPIEDFLKVLRQVSEYYNPTDVLIAITGGEPLLRKDLARCGDAIRDLGFK